jgi:hypothetical protein
MIFFMNLNCQMIYWDLEKKTNKYFNKKKSEKQTKFKSFKHII